MRLFMVNILDGKVAPLAGAWIEIGAVCGAGSWRRKSLPLRERGLKSLYYHLSSPDYMSLPLRERGLKSSAPEQRCNTPLVAPLAGAWIEIAVRLLRSS